MKKKSTLIIASFVLCAVLIAGVTLAYLTATSNEKTNTFTVSDNIAIQLAEPKWDNQNYAGESAGITDPLGQTLAQNIVPSRVIPKNPSVKNNSDIEKVWIAVKLEYNVDGQPSTFAAVDEFATINFLGDNWVAKDASNTVFYYNVPVNAQANTSELFDKVTIDNVDHSALKPFNIVIKGYAVQEEGLTFELAKPELDALINPAS